MDELFSKLKRPFNGTWDAVESNIATFECIMYRLPVKSILMFKSVSKRWYDVMSTKYFIILHRYWSKKNVKFFVYYDADNLKHGIVRGMHLMEPNGTYSESYTIPGFDSIHKPRLIATFNGLICCINDVRSLQRSFDVDLRIRNPATREVLTLPRSHRSIHMPIFGVLYSNNYHIYKIFKFFSDPIDWEMGYTQCEVYSSKTGEWKLLGRVHSHPLMTTSRSLASNHVCLNEKLYWFVAHEVDYDIPVSILTVDMDDNFREIALPTVAQISFLIEFQGRLCFVAWTWSHIYLCLYEEMKDNWYLKDIAPLPVNWLGISYFDVVVAYKHEILFVYRDTAEVRHEIVYDVLHATWGNFLIDEDDKNAAIAVFSFYETLVPCNLHEGRSAWNATGISFEMDACNTGS